MDAQQKRSQAARCCHPRRTSRRAMARQMRVRASSAKLPQPVSAMERESSTATTTCVRRDMGGIKQVGEHACGCAGQPGNQGARAARP